MKSKHYMQDVSVNIRYVQMIVYQQINDVQIALAFVSEIVNALIHNADFKIFLF